MPPKKKGPLTDDEKFQQSLQMETELTSLRGRYEVMDRDLCRAQYTRGKVAQKDRVLEIFEKEYQNVSTDLRVATTREKRKEDKKVNENLSMKLNEYTLYGEECQKERLVIKEAEGQIKIVKKRVIDLTAKQTTERQHADRINHASRTLEALENKLEVQVRKFCGICSKNRELREELHHLMKEREYFMVFWDKTIERLQAGKKIMLDLIEQATIAYDQREDWCSKVQALRYKAKKDIVEFTHRIREMHRKGDNNSKLEEFFATKSQIRNLRRLRVKETLKKMAIKSKMKLELDKYESIVVEVTKFCNQSELDKLLVSFKLKEGENFSMFCYINDLNEEMEKVGYELGNLHLDIDQRRALDQERVSQQSSKIKTLETNLEVALKDSKSCQQILKKADSDLNEMMAGIDSLLKICRAKNDPIIKLLGNADGKIKHYNVLLYLEVLENKVNERFVNLHYKEKHLIDKRQMNKTDRVFPVDVEERRLFAIDEIVTTDPCALCVERECVTEVVDCLQMVYSKQKAIRKLKKTLEVPDAANILHRVSKCALPKARAIVQRRYM